MPMDFGPYGKGIDGYIKYMEAYERIEKEGRKGGRRRPPSGGGCLTSILYLIFAALVIVLLF